jgi:tRNA(Ile)-lysidine synthetase-like protein
VVEAGALDGLDARGRYIFIGDLLHDRIGIADRPAREHYRELSALFERGARSGRMATFPGGCARREYDSVVVFPGVRHPDDTLSDTGGTSLAPGSPARFDGFELSVVALDGGAVDQRDLRAAGKTAGPGLPTVAYFDAGSIELPLVVRHLRPGDRMQPFGMRGRRTLGDILSDRKVPARHRAHALVVEDRLRIVWLVGCSTCETTRVRTDTARVLRVDVERAAVPRPRDANVK